MDKTGNWMSGFGGGGLEQCPICGEMQPYITNRHCILEHGMTRKEVCKEFGEIKRMRVNPHALRENTKISRESGLVTTAVQTYPRLQGGNRKYGAIYQDDVKVGAGR